LIEAAAALSGVQQQLLETIETETAVKLFAARNMPQANDAERSERLAAVQLALRASSDVPLEVMRLCARGLELGATVAAHSARAAFADVRLGVELLQVGFGGARANLEGKLSSFIDAAYVASLVDGIGRLSEVTTRAARAAESFMALPPA
jgi:formiminotetrahydrofolate cyclodeaminase